MTKLSELIDFLHSIAPPELQEDYDNAGLITGYPEMEVTGVMVCLDAIEPVIDEAIEQGCNVVIAHHPIVFRGLKRFNGSNYVERTVIKAIKHDIAILAIHTNLDNVYENGVNTKIADILGLRNVSILAPKNLLQYNNHPVGAGVTGLLPDPVPVYDFLDYLKEKMQLTVLKHTALCKQEVHKVAVCGGSGGFLLRDAVRQGADIFITSDFKYHEFFDADGRIIIADIGHYESEKFTIQLLYELIINNFSNFAARYTKHITNPVHYY
jgi:dinuclear metal center YbgI/SA1388 family protein